MGQGNAVALTSEGLPFVSYFGFAAKLAEGAISIPRPFGSPNVPGVMLSTSSSDGLWQRGAVEMKAAPSAALTPDGVTVPFGPVATNNLDLTREERERDRGDGRRAGRRLRRVDLLEHGELRHVVAREHRDGRHGVHAGRQGLRGRPDRPAGYRAGRLGQPVDRVHGRDEQGRRGARREPARAASGRDQVVASFPGCNGCPSPQPTGIGIVGGAATVVYADPCAKQVVALTQKGTIWTAATVASGVSGYGLSFAAARRRRRAIAAYYTGNGEVDAATFAKGAWTTDKVARRRRTRMSR